MAEVSVQQQNDQFQIGDEVMYLPERVVTTVTGYDWLRRVDDPPKILAYQLACGISAAKDLLIQSISERPYATGGLVHFFEPSTHRAPADAIGKDRMPSHALKGHRLG